MLKQTRKIQQKKVGEFKKTDIGEFADILTYHSDLYYNKQEPIISDSEYDELLKKLQVLEKTFGVVGKYSDMIGAELVESSFEKVAHSRPMISLDNTYNEQDLRDFDTRILKLSGQKQVNYTLEFKFDGLGIELIYNNGDLTQAITRGNGVEGEDVTMNVMQIGNIPKQISITDRIEIRGEIVMPLSSFESLNKQALENGEKVFSNPRNAAAGSIRMKDNRITKKRKLQFFAYDIANWNDEIADKLTGKNNSYYDFIYNLENLGFDISSYFLKSQNIDEVIKNIENFGDTKKKIDFEIDGLVLKVENTDLWSEIGFTQHHPRYAIAYKFPSEMFTTQILSVEHQVGRTGTITPVANLEPVNINGAMIARTTLHNYDEVVSLGIHIGDNVFIKRAGEVIPKITSVASHPDILGESILPPKKCPVCETEVIKDEDKVRYYCPNSEFCPKQISEKLIWSVGKSGFNIDGFGRRQVEIFLEEGILNDVVSIFKIEEHRDQILELEGFQEKSVDNLVSSIEKSKSMDIVTLLSALGVSGVGKKTAKTLAKLVESNESELLTGDIAFEQLEQLDDIGPEIARNVIEYFSNDINKNNILELLDILDITYHKNITQQGVYSGKKMCITGSFIQNDKKIPRDDLVKILEQNGGEFVSSVSKKTDYLLAGEKAGSKLKKAQDLGVVVLNLEEFLNITQ